MRSWPDHLTCPALPRWLEHRLGAASPRCWVAEPSHRWRAPRALVRWTTHWPEPQDPKAPVILVTGLGPHAMAPPSECWRDAPWVADLATMPRAGWLAPLRARRHREGALCYAIQRARAWKLRGAVALEQWVALEPTEILVTVAVRPG